jgi:ankyrin repeat protein
MLSHQERKLFNAAYRGNTAKVDALLKQGVNVNTVNEDGDIPLLCAITGDHEETINLLCDHHADLRYRNTSGETPLIKAICYNKDKSIVNMLLAKGAHFSASIFELAWHGDEAGLKQFNSLGIAKDSSGKSVIHYAALAGHLGMLQWLLKEKWGNPYAKDNMGRTALHYAALTGHLDIVQCLLEMGVANLSEKTAGGNSALCLAVQQGHFETVQWLVEKGGANINEKDHSGCTALHSAAVNGHINIMKWLLEKGGANLFAKSNIINATALIFAIASKQKQMTQLLLVKGAGIKADFLDLDLTNDDMTNHVLIGATLYGAPFAIDGAIHSNEALRVAIDKGVPLDCDGLQQAVAARLVEEPNDTVLQETRCILNTLHNVMLKKAITRGEPLDWVDLRKKVVTDLVQYPDDKELIQTKRIVESLSSLRNRCLFFCADNLNQYPDYRTTLISDLIPEVEKLNEDAGKAKTEAPKGFVS